MVQDKWNSEVKKVLVTGSTGFIGSHLVAKLLERGFRVRCLVRKRSNTEILVKKDVELFKTDYSDINSLKKSLKGIEIVFHLGAIINGKDWDTLFKANTRGTENLIKAYSQLHQKEKKFVFISSIAASGPSGSDYLKKESDSDLPVSLYGKSKLMAEKILKKYGEKVPYVILRPPNVYGPRQKELSTLINVIGKRILPLLGNKNSKTSLLYVEDLVNAIILAGECEAANNKTYFITDNRSYSWRDTLKLIAQVLGVYPFVIPIPGWILAMAAWKLELFSKLFKFNPPFRFKDLQSIRKNRWTFDGTAFMKATGFEPQISLKEGIKKTVELLNTKKK